MADFTPDVQAPANTWMIGKGAEPPKSLLGELSSTLSNVADKGLDMFRQYKGNELQGQEGEELSQAVRDYANGTPLVGQETNPASSDPGFVQAQGEMDRHAQAAAQGSPGAKQALLTRLSEIQSRYASQNPYYAPALAEHAQKILGFNANAQLFQTASESEDFKRTLNQGAQQTLVNKALEAGAAHWSPDGTIDVPQTMLNGQSILVEEHKARIAQEQATLAQTQAKPLLTADQIADQEYRINKPAVLAIGNAASNGVISQIQTVITKVGTSDPATAAHLGGMLGMAEAKATAAAEQYISSHDIGSTAAGQLRAEVKNSFAPIHTILGQDLTNVKLVTDALNTLKASNNIDFHAAAPHVAKAIDIGGPQAGAAIIQGYTSPATNKGEWESLNKEMNNYFNPPPDFHTAMRGANAIMAGQYNVAVEPDKGKAKASLAATFPVLDNFSNRPADLAPKEQRALGNIVGTASAAAIQTQDPEQILNAGTKLVRPGVVQGMIKYAHNPDNANDAPKNLAYYGQYLQRTQQEAGKVLTQGGDFDIPTSGPGHHFDYTHVHYSATVDPKTGTAAPSFVATSRDGKTVALTSADKQQVMRSDAAFGRTLGVYNGTVKADQQITKALQEHMPEPVKEDPKKLEQSNLSKPGNHVFAQKIGEIVPGARITRTVSTAEENARIGGAANSQHLDTNGGTAMDFVPPGPHWTQANLDAFAAKLDAEGLPHTELMIEHKGDPHSTGYHVHWAWGDKPERVAAR